MAEGIIPKQGVTSAEIGLNGNGTGYFEKYGNVVSAYFQIVNMSGVAVSANLGVLPNDLYPKSHYAIASVCSTEPPYKEVGTLWIGNTGGMVVYKEAAV